MLYGFVLKHIPLSLTVITGFWRTREELKKLHSIDEAFLPKGALKEGAGGQSQEYVHALQSWERALQRSMNWYSKP